METGDQKPSKPKAKRVSARLKQRMTAKTHRAITEYIKDPDATLQTIADRSGFASAASVHTALKRHRDEIRARMESRPNLKLDALLEKLERGLEATTKKYAQEKGVFTDEREDADYSTRKEYLFLAHKLRGDLDRDDDDQAKGAQVIANAGAIVNLIIAERSTRGLDAAIPTNRVNATQAATPPAQGDTAR